MLNAKFIPKPVNKAFQNFEVNFLPRFNMIFLGIPWNLKLSMKIWAIKISL